MESKLKPCPFCGSKAYLIKGYKWFYIRCIGCGLCLTKVLNELVAIKSWNTRSNNATD